MKLPSKVKIVEMGPRDGLQNEAEIVTAPIKITLVDKLTNNGFRFIEAGSFVSPKWIPQMADSSDVMTGIRRKAGVVYSVLVPNMKGFEGALAADASEIAIFGAASEAFSKKNINCSIEESLARFEPVCEAAMSHGIPVRGYVSTVLDCPYQGPVPAAETARVSKLLYDMGCHEVSLGDTIGRGTPRRAQEMIEAVAAHLPIERIALHFHDTYGQALANILACMELGIAVIDSSVAGLGGCPYASGASGNVATEDVLYMLRGLDIETGIDFEGVVETAEYISGELGRPPASKVARALAAGKAAWR